MAPELLDPTSPYYLDTWLHYRKYGMEVVHGSDAVAVRPRHLQHLESSALIVLLRSLPQYPLESLLAAWAKQ